MAYKRISNRKIIQKPWKERLWSKINKTSFNSCWEFMGCKNKLGYGNISLNHKPKLSHRLAWESVNGTIPDGLLVLHRCDNPPCCNPNHLFLGTNADNVRDRHQKGHSRGGSLKGEAHPNSKLTDEQVKTIRGSNIDDIILAKKFSVHYKTIESIRNKRGWLHVA